MDETKERKERGTFMRIAVVTDSNSGITQKQAAEMGVYVLPMPFMSVWSRCARICLRMLS